MSAKIFLLLGTNLGNKLRNLESAIEQIEWHIGKTIARSSAYTTKAWGKTDQPDFYNQVIGVETDLNAYDLLKVILDIEKSMGRSRKEKWGERIIDIDILLYGDTIINSDSLRIPHPEMQNRRFTLVPLAEIAPDFVHPVYQKTVTDLLKGCPDTLAVEKLG